MTLVEIIKIFDGKQSGNGYMAKCPAHDDRTASLSIAQGKNGGIVMKCHAGCLTESILATKGLTMSDLFNEPLKQPATTPAPQKRITETYDYVDGNGKLLFQKLRYEPKTFAQRRPDPDKPGEWLWSMGTQERVIYHLPQVLSAIKEGKQVFVVEGEKAVDAAESIGIVATCAPDGAGKWRDHYSKSLKDADVIILPDADAPGHKHAKAVEKSIRNIAKSVQIIELPDLPDKGDIYDYIEARDAQEPQVIKDEMLNLLKPQEKEIFEIWKLSDINNYVPDPKNFLAGNGWLRRGAGTLLTGGTGIGKSILAEQISLNIASGVNILDCIAVEQPYRVLHIQAENDEDTIKRDIESIIKNIKPTMESKTIEETFRICHIYGLTDVEFALWLRRQCEKFKPDLLSIDPYQAYVPSNMDINSAACFLSWIRPINEIIRDFNCALMLVTHTPKPRDREGWTSRESVYMAVGSSAIANWARTSAELTQAGDEDWRFRLRFGKNPERTGVIDDNGRIVKDLFVQHSDTIHEPYWNVSDDQSKPTKSTVSGRIKSIIKSDSSLSDEQIAEMAGCNRSTVYRTRKEMLK